MKKKKQILKNRSYPYTGVATALSDLVPILDNPQQEILDTTGPRIAMVKVKASIPSVHAW